MQRITEPSTAAAQRAARPHCSEQSRIRVMVFHRQELFRTSVAHLLSAEPDFEVAGEGALAGEAISALIEANPDVALFEFACWNEFLPAARDGGYQGKFLAIAGEGDPANFARALARGISGLVTGSESRERLVQAIHVVASGAAWLDQPLIQSLAARYPHHEDLRMQGLAERERAVLHGILGGLTNRMIAEKIGSSEATVKAVLQQLFQKTGVRTRSQLVRIMLAGA